MEINDSIGVRLREVREKMELSQTKFAEIAEVAGAVGTTRQSQSNYEKGKRMPDASYFSAIAAAGADTHYILTGETPQQRLLKTLKESTSKVADLPLVDECKAAIAQLLTGLQANNMDLVTDALDIIRSDYVGLGEAKGATETVQNLRPDQAALLDNIEHCAKEDQEAIKRMAFIAAKADKTDEAKSGKKKRA